jgi:hypothetical protein
LTHIVMLFVIYEEIKTLIQISLYPIRNNTLLNILAFDIVIPFTLTSITNAMCD